MTSADALRVIVADDEAVIRMGLTAMLYTLKHKVVATARTGEEAIEKVKQFNPDLLLLDIKMPVMDGLAAARILTEEAPLPIVMLTALSQQPLVEQAVAALVMGYLVKPIDERKLGPTIDLAVARYREMQAKAQEADQLKQRLAGRALIDQAKQRLMQQGLTENEAYHRLQAAARRRQISLADVARRILANRGPS
jgi:response regulator NasT